MFWVADGLEYASLIYADFPITKTSTRQVEIRSDEESFCIHCVLDIFQSVRYWSSMLSFSFKKMVFKVFMFCEVNSNN